MPSPQPPSDGSVSTQARPFSRANRLYLLNLSAHLANLDACTKNIEFKYSIKCCRFAHALATPTIELGTRQRIGAGGRLPGDIP